MLRIIRVPYDNGILTIRDYSDMLCKLAIAEASMIKSNSKALDHFIAIVKELERIYGFKFEEYKEPTKEPHKNQEESSPLDIETSIKSAISIRDQYEELLMGMRDKDV
jgi:hypothetical protein